MFISFLYIIIIILVFNVLHRSTIKCNEYNVSSVNFERNTPLQDRVTWTWTATTKYPNPQGPYLKRHMTFKASGSSTLNLH